MCQWAWETNSETKNMQSKLKDILTTRDSKRIRVLPKKIFALGCRD